ncbi:hypothetical protein [Alkalihalobacillus sp. AL-G]|uniref:hypothetical protein n=1 Tax=Alkalihalobacillus sp. AL-G TaxID=2926399 RepID=UPI00272BFCC0|nr:hypothetical protein [Alkalihalobacillus sp. AL-G]WLD94431.1 hypothetical protein MOJ78_05955 [Alkalihalobacillus sp. AL-G]
MIKIMFRNILFVSLISLAGCSNETTKVTSLLGKNDAEKVSVSVLDQPTTDVDAPDDIQSLFKIIEGLTVQKASKEEMIEVHNLERDADYQSIIVMIHTNEEKPSLQLTLLNDGRMLLFDIEDGLGQNFYKSLEDSKSLYNKVLDFYKNRVASGNSDKTQVLDELEKKDGKREIEVELIRSSE